MADFKTTWDNRDKDVRKNKGNALRRFKTGDVCQNH